MIEIMEGQRKQSEMVVKKRKEGGMRARRKWMSVHDAGTTLWNRGEGG